MTKEERKEYNRIYSATHRKEKNAYEKKYKKENPEKYKKKFSLIQKRYSKNKANKAKMLARWAVKRAIKNGSLVRLSCETCGIEKTEAHHASYKKEDQLKVSFLCNTCHRDWHTKYQTTE
jgi:hypothetical protein